MTRGESGGVVVVVASGAAILMTFAGTVAITRPPIAFTGQLVGGGLILILDIPILVDCRGSRGLLL